VGNGEQTPEMCGMVPGLGQLVVPLGLSGSCETLFFSSV
jgi:hypothetical protein